MLEEQEEKDVINAELGTAIDFARSGRGDREMERVAEHELPTEIETLIADYGTLHGSRNQFIWRWVHRLAPQFTFSFVRPDSEETVSEVKTVATLFLTLLDDLLEKERDQETFREAAKIPFDRRRVEPSRTAVDSEYIAVTERVWEALLANLRAAPHWNAYCDVLRYDLKQAIDAIESSYFIMRNPELVGLEELTRKTTHNMMMHTYADIDLMYASAPLEDELPLLREAVWHAQFMARVGNWLSTWERELAEHDYSSGVIVHALEEGIISTTDLNELEEDESEAASDRIAERIRAAGIEEHLLKKWQRHHDELAALGREFDAVDIESYVEGMRKVLRYHLASEGLK